MFGFSLPKIFILLIITVLVWNFFKLIEKKTNKKKVEEDENFYKKKQTREEDEALIECDNCGSFYSLKLEKCPECGAIRK